MHIYFSASLIFIYELMKSAILKINDFNVMETYLANFAPSSNQTTKVGLLDLWLTGLLHRSYTSLA